MTYHDNSPAVLAAVERAMTHATAEITAALEAETKLQLQHMVYDTPESPTYKRTGNLMGSIHSTSRGNKGTVYIDADYALYVHEGTQHMAPRPFADTALRREERRAPRRVDRALEREGLA